MKLQKKNVVEQSYQLNQLVATGWTLQELRLLTVYLSKINARDRATSSVKFTLADYSKLFGIEVNEGAIDRTTDNLMNKRLKLVRDNGGFNKKGLFTECDYDPESGTITIDLNPKLEQMFFDLSRDYFKYELWNAIRLKSPIQVRMYQLLKQREKLGRWEVSPEVLQELLGVTGASATRWNNFRVWTLDACQRALKETTDISYEYCKGRGGRGGKWLSIVFKIKKNIPEVDQISIDELLLLGEPNEIDEVKETEEDEFRDRVRAICENMTFRKDQMNRVIDKLSAVYDLSDPDQANDAAAIVQDAYLLRRPGEHSPITMLIQDIANAVSSGKQ